MVDGLALTVPAESGHGLRIGEDLHRLGDCLHPVDRHHDGHGTPLTSDGDRMILCLLDHGGESLLGGLDRVAVGHTRKSSFFRKKARP